MAFRASLSVFDINYAPNCNLNVIQTLYILKQQQLRQHLTNSSEIIKW